MSPGTLKPYPTLRGEGTVPLFYVVEEGEGGWEVVNTHAKLADLGLDKPWTTVEGGLELGRALELCATLNAYELVKGALSGLTPERWARPLLAATNPIQLRVVPAQGELFP